MKLSEIIKEDGLKRIRDRKDHIKGQAYEYDVKDAFTGSKRGWVYLDQMSLSALKAVYNGLKPENQAKFDNFHITKLLDLAWKHVSIR